ncbi:hypothetical protein ZHAS_00001715 [Anopheles sinensis]|uniref:Uncharacterized protein n=1 Tax=Anopheles sinensis TaxID=74873 RepID=A0A084VBJ4_ANOSI|nr:hypothetical protein ZHAS_00001715 [Anopheles sinensis]
MLQGKTILQRGWKLSFHPSKKHKKRMNEGTHTEREENTALQISSVAKQRGEKV